MEQCITDLRKSLNNQNEISEKNYDNLYPSGSKPGILYGLGKIHKALEDGIPAFRPILTAIGTHTYELAKFCDKLLKPIITNEHTIKDSFSFDKVDKFDRNLIMASFDVKSLFTFLLHKLLTFVSRIFIETKHILTVYQKVLFVGY